jgi:hypothetical protein
VKQLTILCSSDLSEKVQEVLIRSGAGGFLNLRGATGTKPGASAPHGRPARWPAEMFVAPVEDAVARKVVEELRDYAGDCLVEPCLRILVGPLDEVY